MEKKNVEYNQYDNVMNNKYQHEQYNKQIGLVKGSVMLTIDKFKLE